MPGSCVHSQHQPDLTSYLGGESNDYAKLIKSLQWMWIQKHKNTVFSLPTFTVSSPQLMETLIRVLYFPTWKQQRFTTEQTMHSLLVICLQPPEMAKIRFVFLLGSEKFDSSLPCLSLKQINSNFLSLLNQIVKTTAGVDVSCRARKKKNRKTIRERKTEREVRQTSQADWKGNLRAEEDSDRLRLSHHPSL